MDASTADGVPRRGWRDRIDLGLGGGCIGVVKLSCGDNGSKMEEISRVLRGEKPGRRSDNSGSEGTQPHCWRIELKLKLDLIALKQTLFYICDLEE